ncbi:MAG: ATP-binding protein [Planctomycetes bacterium]|nr:ATP-binding protein [Planctomycetota bacterium]
MIRRHLKPLILESLKEFPVVAILGGRQVGKSTLAQDLSSADWPARYYTLDDFAVLSAALRDPEGYVDSLETTAILDEVQRAPDLLRAVKRAVDRSRQPGRFLLTGSANLLTLKSVSESLAGRVALFELHPFSWSEITGDPSPPPVLENLFSCKTAPAFLKKLPGLKSAVKKDDLAQKILAGGFPVPALMKSGRTRAQWFDSYRQTYLERDLRDLAQIMNLPDFGRLLTSSAFRSGQLLNTAELSRDLGIPLNTVRRHLGILETTYQLWLAQPYFANIGKRLVKSPKVYFNDTGLALGILGIDSWKTLEQQGREGAVVETWAAGELRKLAALSSRRTEVLFWRTHTGQEVDFILARGEALAAIEVKWSQTLKESELAGLESCQKDLSKNLGLAVVLYPGETAFAFDERTAAVPFSLFFGSR